MICAVSLNPAVDKYLRLEKLRPGEHLEVEEAISSAGGKAINVAGVLRVLGEAVEVVGFFGGPTGAFILEEVAREGIAVDAVEIASPTRTAFVMVEADGTETEVVEPGAAVSAAEIEALRTKVRRAAAGAAVVVLSGSVPPGCPDDIYMRLLDDCGGRCPVIVDTSRQWLRAVLAARGGQRPTVIKPNRREAEAAVGRKLESAADLTACLRGFAASGVALPLISDGAAGLYAWTEAGLWRAQPPALARVNSVGSGDAAVAGAAAALARGEGTAALLRLATACGAANVLTQECAAVRRDDLERLLPQIAITAPT